MFNAFFAGSQYNKSTTAKMKFVSKDLIERMGGQVAAQITYQASK